MNSKNKLQPDIEISSDILSGARDLLAQYALDSGVDLENLITQLSNTGIDAPSIPKAIEKMPATGEIRLARIGWTEVAPTTEEVGEAVGVVQSIRRISRFGYQMPAYILTANETKLSGIVIPGDQNKIESIWSTLGVYKRDHQEMIEKTVPGCLDFKYIDCFKPPYDTKFSDLINRDTQRITIIRNKLKEPSGNVSALGVPAMDGNYDSQPYVSQALINRVPSKALQIIEFRSPEEKQMFEETLINHQNPLAFLKNIYSVLFSPDMCTELLGLSGNGVPSTLIEHGQAGSGYARDNNSMLDDLRGFAFHFEHSLERGGNNKPLIV